MSSFTNTTNFDNLLLQTLMGRLQIRPPNNPFHSQSLEDLLFEAANLSDDDNDDDDENDENNSSKTQLAKEESKLEKEIVRVILSGKTDSLKPNSGQAVTIGEHHICVGFHEETGSDYRVWEWHGHIMLFDEENGYTPEYIYGNYFERLLVKSRGVEEEKEEEQEQEQEEKEEKVSNLGLRELIDAGDSNGARILHRNVNAGSPRFI
uniref:FK506-binding protein n=1 Tax=Fagus sylvatica TaxID=28930 RepID=A0A2N9HQV1_FAGSY